MVDLPNHTPCRPAGGARRTMIVADSEVVCDVMGLAEFDRLGTTHPGIKIKLLENLCLCLCRRLRTVNRKLAVFD